MLKVKGINFTKPGTTVRLTPPPLIFAVNLSWHGQPMSNGLCQAGGMKSSSSSWLGLSPVEKAARFDAARLVRKLDGRHEFIGGTPAEHSAAREWCSLFAPKVVLIGASWHNVHLCHKMKNHNNVFD
jgi:hypothetical protein